MFRNLIRPCAPRSQGQNQTECVTVSLLYHLPGPGTPKFCACSEDLEMLAELEQIPPPPGRPSDCPRWEHFCLPRFLSSLFGPLLCYLGFSSLWSFCLFHCPTFLLNCELSRTEAVTASSSHRASHSALCCKYVLGILCSPSVLPPHEVTRLCPYFYCNLYSS